MLQAREALDTAAELARADRWGEAAELLRSLVRKCPDDEDALQALSYCLLHLGADQEIVNILASARGKMPALDWLHRDLANALERLDRYDEAVLHWRVLTELCPEDADYWNDYALALRQIGDLGSARIAIERAIQLNPSDNDIRANSGGIYLDLQDSEASKRAYLAAVELQPSDADSWYHLGVIYSDEGSYEESERAFRHALDLNPAGFEAWNNLGIALRRLGRTDEAVESYRAAVRACPTHWKAWSNLGRAFEAGGDDRSALAAYEEARKGLADDPDLKHRLSLVRRRLRRAPQRERSRAVG